MYFCIAVWSSGRDGSSAQAHLFFNAKKKCTDDSLTQFMGAKENCRRKFLLEGVGGSFILRMTDVVTFVMPILIQFKQ